MADDRDVVVVDDDESKIVTKFLLNTCGLLQPTKDSVFAAATCCEFPTSLQKPADDDNDYYNNIPLLTGSSAEFYIQPMLSCVGDVDVMFHRCNHVAIPGGYSPPIKLPAEFDSRVKVYEIIDTEYPCYVYLMWSYLLTEDSDTGKYNAVRYDEPRYVHFSLPPEDDEYKHHGPALTRHGNEYRPSLDRVNCVRCLSWPSQAADWPTRHSNYDWPDSATVDHVVSNGCDVVHVTHPLCRQDEWISKCQCRLSFSRAEIMLLNSWMPVQQIVYHMLRFFVKTEKLTDITDSTGTKIFSNYHFKTLTLWACELQPQRWWTDDMNVVRLSVTLLHVFGEWVKNQICPHYFVNNCNLLYDTIRLEIIVSQLALITESWLSTWFVNNYLRKCAQLCPDRVSRLFDDVSTSMKLQNAVSAVVDWRRNSALEDLCKLWDVCFHMEFRVSLYIYRYSLTLQTCFYWNNAVVKISSCLRHYFIAVAFLHISKRSKKHSLSDELLDVLASLVCHFVGKRRYCHQHSSELSLSQAVILMKVVANNSRGTVQQIQFALSKAYLHRALRCKDSESDSIYCLANVYLAVLYYTSGQYQTAIDHCTLVMRSQDHSQCSSHVVQGDVLPKVDDDIDTVLGLAMFYQYVRTAALNQQQTQYFVVFTRELFAHYLYIRCLSVINCRPFTQSLSNDEVQPYTKHILSSDQLLIADVTLLKLIKMWSDLKFHYNPLSEQRQCSTIDTTELDTSELVELLQQSAVEHLTTYRQLYKQQFGSVFTIVTTDFEALHEYKHGDYQRCLELSTQNVHTLLRAFGMTEVLTFPEFIQWLDDDVVSLTALTLFVNPECRDNSSNVSITQLTLSLYLMTQCQLKLHHSVMSLAQTLDYIGVAQRGHPVKLTLNNLTLKLTERKVMIYLSKITQC